MGSFIQKPNNFKISTFQNYTNIQVSSSCQRGWRKFMEDSHLIVYPLQNDMNLGIFAVFDGHGGPEVAEFAKNHYQSCLINNVNFKMKNYEKSLVQSFLQLDRMLEASQGKLQLEQLRKRHWQAGNSLYYEGDSKAGATINVILLAGQYVYCANAGDCRSVACIKNVKSNSVQPLSYDHKPYLQIQKNRIIRAGGTVDYKGRINSNLNLSRAIGDFAFKENTQLNHLQQIVIAQPDVTKIKTSELQFIVMGCDGIWETKNNEYMIKWLEKKLRTKKTSIQVLQSLLDSQLAWNSYDNHGVDNMTAILIQFR